MTDITNKIADIDETLNIIVPVITDCVARLEALENAIGKLAPTLEAVVTQQRAAITQLRAQLAAKDAELARLRGVTLN